MKGSIKYYIWSENEFLAQVSELNVKTAIQKAKLIARFNNKAEYTLSTSSIHGLNIVTTGKSAQVLTKKVSRFNQIVEILTNIRNTATRS